MYRKAKNMTQNDLAYAISCDVKYLGDIENGWFYPSSDLLERIIDVLQIPVYMLFIENETKPQTDTDISLINN